MVSNLSDKTGKDNPGIICAIYSSHEHQQETENVFIPIFYFEIFKVQNPENHLVKNIC